MICYKLTLKLQAKKNPQEEYHKVGYVLSPKDGFDIYTPSSFDVLKFDFKSSNNETKTYQETISELNGTNVGSSMDYSKSFSSEKSFFDFHKYNPENDISKLNAFPSLVKVGNTQTKIHNYESNTCKMKEAVVFLSQEDMFTRAKEIENVIYNDGDCPSFYKGVFFDKATITIAHYSGTDFESILNSTKRYAAKKKATGYDYSVYFDFKSGFKHGLTDGGTYNINNLANLSTHARTAHQDICASSNYKSGYLSATSNYASLSYGNDKPLIQEESYTYKFEILTPDTLPTGICYTSSTVISNLSIDKYGYVAEDKNAQVIYEDKTNRL